MCSSDLLKYGLLQVTEALQFLHYSGHVIHRNVCPNSVVVTKRGVWKLAGMEFLGEFLNFFSPTAVFLCSRFRLAVFPPIVSMVYVASGLKYSRL